MQNKEVGKLEEAIPLDQFGAEGLDIRFYAPYLLNGLQVFPDDKITFFLKNSSKPVIFQAEKADSQVVYLVMPVSPTSM